MITGAGHSEHAVEEMEKRSRGPRGGIVGSMLWMSLLLAHSASGSAASLQPAPRLAVEEALRQAARITWTDDSASVPVRHRLQRRVRDAAGHWSGWGDVSVGDGNRQDLAIDAGPDGRGLPPADYAYRVQLAYSGAGASSEWSEWSAPVEFTMPPQCDGGKNPPGNEAPGSLPTAVIGDLDGDRRYTGADVWIALQRCSKLGGCVLEALPVTYDDVAISLYGQNDKRPCYVWNSLVCEPMPPFPNGLVIQGHGSATVFRSPVWRTPYKPSGIFEFWHVPPVQLRFRNFVLDGRKSEQPDPTAGVNDMNTWRHVGLEVTHHFGPDHGRRQPDGCVHNVTVRNFLWTGIQVNHARNWRIEFNRVQDVGCWKGLTECPRLTIPDSVPPPQWGCAGLQSSGYGIEIGEYTEDTTVAHNEITRVTKYGLGVKGGNEGNDPIPRLSVRDNQITNVGTLGIFLAGAVDSVIERNLVDGTHSYGCREGGAWFSWGIQTNGKLRNTRIRANTLRNLTGLGIGSNAIADGLVFEDNQIDNVCTEQNAAIGSRQGAIQLADRSAGDFTFSRNSVTENRCSMALAVCWGSNAQVVVDGGYYSTGENSDPDFGAVYVESGNLPKSPRVVLRGGVVFDYLGSHSFLGRRRRPGIVSSGNARVVVQDASVRVNHYSEPFDVVRSCVDGCSTQKKGVIIQCAEDPSSPECR